MPAAHLPVRLCRTRLFHVVAAAFLGGMAPAANAMIATLVPPERRGSAFGWTASASGLAQGIGPMIGAAVATGFGMPAVFLVTGTFYAVAFGWALLGMRGIRLAPPEPVPVAAHPVAPASDRSPAESRVKQKGMDAYLGDGFGTYGR